MKILIGCFLALITLGACKKSADTAEYEAKVAKVLTEQGVKPDKVSCPKNIVLKEGTVFVCTVTVGGDDYKLETTIGAVKDNHAETKERWVDGPPPGLGGGGGGGDEGGEAPEDEGGEAP